MSLFTGLTALPGAAMTYHDARVSIDAAGGRIVVGVDGSSMARHAVLWAARAARLHRENLIIAHVAPEDLAPIPRSITADRERLLNESAAAASQHEPSVVVGSLLLHGSASEELIRLTASTTLLVLGVERTKPRSGHGALGSVEDRVVLHSTCPVVTVSHPRQGRSTAPPTVVSVWTPQPASWLVLRKAAEEARLERADLHVVATHISAVDGSTGVPDSDKQLLATQLRSLAALDPALKAEIWWADGCLKELILRESTGGLLLVMPCESAEDRWSIRTGVLVEAAMGESACPVMLINSITGRRFASSISGGSHTAAEASRGSPATHM